MLALLLSLAIAATWPTDPNAAGLAWSTIDSGVQLVDLADGGQPQAVEGARVVVHYTGMLSDGTVFDSSVERGKPFSFKIGEHRVIRGWEDGLIGAGPGAIRRLVIPPDQGYGDNPSGPIPPGSTLYFEVEVLEVYPPRVAPTSPQSVDPGAFKKRKGAMWADLAKGDGRKPVDGERVCVDWTAWVEGQLIEHTLDRDECRWFRYEPGKVAEGLYDGIATMREGGMRQLRIPPELATGELRPQGIDPDATILYEVRLVEAKPKVR